MDRDCMNVSTCQKKIWLCGPFLGLLALLASSEPGRAQVPAAIVGRVEDASATGVSGATITVKSQENGATRVVTTDNAGNYRVLSLILGPYAVKAEKNGFKATIRTGINLQVGQEAVVNLRLELGEFVQQISVSADVPVVDVTTASVSERSSPGRGCSLCVPASHGSVASWRALPRCCCWHANIASAC